MRAFLLLLPLLLSGIVNAGDSSTIRTADIGSLSYFVQVKHATINDPESNTKHQVDLKMCAKLCLDDITCASFEHNEKNQTCSISKKNANKFTVEFHGNHDYYQAIIPDQTLIGLKGVAVLGVDELEQFRKVSVDDCEAKCRKNLKCKSIAYKTRTKLCKLNDVTSLDQNLEASKWGWDTYFLHQDKKEVNCGSPPTEGYKSVAYSTTIYKSVALYRCGLGETFSSICGIDGKWSKPNGTCKQPTTCKEFKKCAEFVPDGEYWIYPVGLHGKKMKVYCSGMQTCNPKEYISLLEENFTSYPPKKAFFFCFTRTSLDWKRPGKTLFTKVRINPKTLKVNTSDFTFANLVANTGNTMWPYGTAADCLYEKDSRCKSEGQMKVDLTGTGLAVDRRVSWRNYGNNSRIAEYKRSQNDQVITATCGGYCGGCKPLCIKLIATKIGPAENTARSCEFL